MEPDLIGQEKQKTLKIPKHTITPAMEPDLIGQEKCRAGVVDQGVTVPAMEPDLIGQEKGPKSSTPPHLPRSPQWSLTSSVRKSHREVSDAESQGSRNGA